MPPPSTALGGTSRAAGKRAAPTEPTKLDTCSLWHAVAHCARCSAAPQQKKKCGRKKGHIVGLGSPSKQWTQGGLLDVPRSSRSRTTPKIIPETPGGYFHKVGWHGGAATPATLTAPKAAPQVPPCMPSALLVLTKVLRRVCRRRQEHQHALLRI